MKDLLDITLGSCCDERFQWFSRRDEPMPVFYVDAGYEAAADFYIQVKDCGSEAKNSYTLNYVEAVRVILEFSIASCKLLTISLKIPTLEKERLSPSPAPVLILYLGVHPPSTPKAWFTS